MFTKNKKKILSLGLSFIIGVVGLLAVLKINPLRAASSMDNTLEQLRLLTEVFDYIQKSYVTEKSTKDLVYGAAHGMVHTLDPFSQFMEPEAHKEMQTETEGQFGGLGIRIEMRDEWLTVMTPIPDTPAYRAGILPGDKIIKIENQLVTVRVLRGDFYPEEPFSDEGVSPFVEVELPANALDRLNITLDSSC